MDKNVDGYLYKQLAAEIEGKIHQGVFQAGDRLPSIRNLHKKLHLSLTTVYHAYVELETLGLIDAKPKSGYYVKPARLDRIPVPAYHRKRTNPKEVRMISMVNSVVAAANNPDLIPLGASTLSPELLPVKHFTKILKSINTRDMKGMLTYALTEGDLKLRRRLAAKSLGVLDGTGPEDIIITNGCVEAVNLCLQALVKRGDVVVIESPTYFGFLQMLKKMGALVIEAPTDPRYGVDLEELEKILKQTNVRACLFMPNFHNPLGALMPDDHKRELVKMLNRHEVPVIEDDIYAELHFKSKRPTLLKSFDRKDLVLTCSSFSKALAPGMRIGWAAPGKRFREKVRELKAGYSISSSSIEQYIMAAFLTEGHYDRCMRSIRSAVKKQVIDVVSTIQKLFPPGIRLAVPQGGPLLWVQLPPKVDSMDLYYRAMENNVSIVPGTAFTSSRRFRNFIRISCGNPFDEKIEKGIKTLGRLVREAAATGEV